MSRELATAVAIGVMMLANAVVGVSLLRTAMKTKRRPELLIGLGLFGMGPISQGLTVMAGMGRATAGEVDPVLHALGSAGGAVGMACIFLFVLTVFRPGVLWARIFTGLAMVALVGGNVATIVHLHSAPPEMPSAEATFASGLVILGVFTVAFGWAALESGLYYARARKRLRLGLIEPTVANRFLLWAVASGSAFLLGACLIGFQLRGEQITGGLVPSLITMGVSMITGASMYLAFLPPRAYLDWVQRRASAAGLETPA